MRPCLKTKQTNRTVRSLSLLQQVLRRGLMSSHFQVLRSTAAFLETHTSNLETVDDGLGDSSVQRALIWHGQSPGFGPWCRGWVAITVSRKTASAAVRRCFLHSTGEVAGVGGVLEFGRQERQIVLCHHPPLPSHINKRRKGRRKRRQSSG